MPKEKPKSSSGEDTPDGGKPNRFTSFREFGAAMGRPVQPQAKPQAKPQERPRSELDELFERTVGGRIDRIPEGNFKSNLEPITSIAFTRQATETPGNEAVSATIFYPGRNGKPHNTTWSIFEGGISGIVPRDLLLSSASVRTEILRILGTIHIEFWHQTALDILPFKDEGEARGPVFEDGARKSEEPRFDPDRLAFFETQPKAIFGFVNRRHGFRGYYGTVFPHLIILEHPIVDHAMYVVHLSEPVLTRVAGKPSAEEVEAILEKHWRPLADLAKTKKQLVEAGAKRLTHKSPEWKKRTQEIIDQEA